jgi:predicted MPP superfamily phosphohydrolase
VADLWIWRRLDKRLATLPHARAWQSFWAIAVGPPMFFMLGTLVAFQTMGRLHRFIPPPVGAYIYIWHFLILPFLLIGSFIEIIAGRIQRGLKKLSRKDSGPVPASADSGPPISRRHFLTAAAATVPPILTAGLAGVSLMERGQFRIFPYDLQIPGLPRELDGMTIAHVADIHTGIFTTPKMLNDIAEATNNLRADLVLLGGDLVNLSHGDLPSALDMVDRMDAKYGIYMVEGNHDVIYSPWEFANACHKRSVRLLVDQIETLRVRGAPMQILGAQWVQGDKDIFRDISQLARRRDPEIFPLLLTHHPHGWDEARRHGLPLTLAGHTHGGQIMLTKNIGGGPLRFRYWSGLYQKDNTQLVVSNGVGNWFPLRVNAPAEILKITLHC